MLSKNPVKSAGLQEYLSAGLICASGVVLIGLQSKSLGWLLLLASGLSLLLTYRQFKRDAFLLVIALAILGITPITTEISYRHMLVMGSTLTLAILIPYVISRYIYKDHLIRFKFHHGRPWFKSELLYIAVTAIGAYFVLPYYLKSTNAYLNWPSATDPSSLVRLFIGTNGLGIWDELFFISTVLGILRRHFPFSVANLMQAVLFSAFLYELGFTGWGPLMIFGLALSQGYIFKKTESLLYVITIHLTLDFILFLALINAHHPELVPIFITS